MRMKARRRGTMRAKMRAMMKHEKAESTGFEKKEDPIKGFEKALGEAVKINKKKRGRK